MKILPMVSFTASLVLFGIAAWLIASPAKQLVVPPVDESAQESLAALDAETSELLAKKQQTIRELESAIKSLEAEINAKKGAVSDQPAASRVAQQFIKNLQDDPQLLEERMQSSFDSSWGSILKEIGVDDDTYNAIKQSQAPSIGTLITDFLVGDKEGFDPYGPLAAHLTPDQLEEFKRLEHEQNLAIVKSQVELQILQNANNLGEESKQWLTERMIAINLDHYTFIPSNAMNQQEGDKRQLERLNQLRTDLSTHLDGNELMEAQALLDKQIMLAQLTLQINQQLRQ